MRSGLYQTSVSTAVSSNVCIMNALRPAEQPVHFRKWKGPAEIRKRALLGNLGCRLQEAGPRHASQRPTDADASNAGVSKCLHRRKVTPDEDVHGFGSNRLDHHHDVGDGAYAGREEAIGSGAGV